MTSMGFFLFEVLHSTVMTRGRNQNHRPPTCFLDVSHAWLRQWHPRVSPAEHLANVSRRRRTSL